MNPEAYTLLEKLGEGSYGSVVKATNKATGQLVAIKYVLSQAPPWARGH